MAQHRDHLEPQADGFVGFHTKSGEHWKHRDVVEPPPNTGYRVFISDRGEERRYSFSPREPHDATLFDLREQLVLAKPADAPPRS